MNRPPTSAPTAPSTAPAAAQPATWLLLRGLTREQRHWGDFVPRLQAAWPQARVIALDLPGNGVRHRERTPASVAALADFCHAELATLASQGVPRPCHLLAMSLGAMVALAWAERHPGDIAAAALINTSLRPYSRFWQRLRPGNYATLLRHLLGPGTPVERERTILNLTSRCARSPADTAALLHEWAGYRSDRPVSAANALRQLQAAARFRASAQPPACPLLLLGGAQDRLVDPRCSQALARAWQLPLRLHPQAGHDLPLDAPDWLIEQLQDWLGPDQVAAGASRVASVSSSPSS